MKKSSEIIINILFWLIIITLACLFFYGIDSFLHASSYKFHLSRYLNFLIRALPGPFFSYYLFYSYVVPLLQKKKFVLTAFLTLLGSLVSALIMFYSSRIFYIEGPFYNNLLGPIVFSLFFGFCGSAIKGSVLWRTSVAEKKALEKKHSESKTALLLLKAQLNPHFLFNSLNNIDILIAENPKTASEYLKKLSDILRYVLYETKEDKTDLAKEITQIRSYVELQKIRTDNRRYVNLTIRGSITEQKIAPMIFLPFIENAFKHSKNKTIENAITIEFDIENDSVKMICKNYYEAGQLEIVKNEGLGIETIEQRLHLLYLESHNLAIDKTENWYKVTLNIDLSNDN